MVLSCASMLLNQIENALFLTLGDIIQGALYHTLFRLSSVSGLLATCSQSGMLYSTL